MKPDFQDQLTKAILRQSQIVHTRMAGQAVIRVVNRCNEGKINAKLNLSGCQLVQVPEAVYHLMRETKLTTCNLSNNAIKKITPKFVLKFPHIKELDLSHNKLSKLPDELKDCKLLEKIDLSHNSLVELPPVLYQLPNIKTIIVNNNFIMDIEFDRMPAECILEHLDIRENPLSPKTHSILTQVDTVKISLTPRKQEEWDDLTV